MSIDRRKLFALGGLGALAGVGGAQGPELSFYGGITIRIYLDYEGKWLVAVPDFNYVNSDKWQPGHVVPVVGMPLNKFLAELERKPDST